MSAPQLVFFGGRCSPTPSPLMRWRSIGRRASSSSVPHLVAMGLHGQFLIWWLWDCTDTSLAKSMLGLPMLAAVTLVGVVFLVGGAVMASHRAPLQASGETLGPICRIGWRRPHNAVFLLEGVILLARGVPGVGSEDVRCCAHPICLSSFRLGGFCCVFSLFGLSIPLPALGSLYPLLYSFSLLLSMKRYASFVYS